MQVFPAKFYSPGNLDRFGFGGEGLRELLVYQSGGLESARACCVCRFRIANFTGFRIDLASFCFLFFRIDLGANLGRVECSTLQRLNHTLQLRDSDPC